jgi:lysyl-tRNA synthetase class 2
MKRLLANNPVSIYQICKAFRDDELGSFHNPEFTLLEWYRLDFDYFQLMDELQVLVETLCEQSDFHLCGGSSFQRLSYQQAFENTVGFNPHLITSSECFRYAGKHGVDIPQGLNENDELDDWLDWLLTQCVLPAFAKDAFTFLYDYPGSQCALAKIEPNGDNIPVASRFELFFGEIELANGFQELTDPVEQLQRFKLENKARNRNGKSEANIDKHFIAALEAGLPECSGVALGLDRFLMVLTGVEKIDQVLTFSWKNA